MKKLDDLVFKNLHGLKDEEDETKHKQDKPNPGDFNMGRSEDSLPQGHTQADYNKMLELQKQQQLMYNYYMMQQRQQQQNPQYGGQQLPPFNPAFLQNMQQMQNMQNRQQMQAMQNMQPQMNMNASNMNNPFGPMSMGNQANQFSQMNRGPQQNQYAQMYQNQMNQAMNSGQAGQFGQMNQGFQSGNQNIQAKKAAPTNDFDDFGDFSTSSGNQQQNQGFKAQNKHDDDFADFQGASSHQQHAHGNQPGFQNFGQSNMGGFSKNFSSPTDDFDDFQDSTGGKAGLSTTQASTKGDDFADFQSSAGQQANVQAGGQGWDMLDDFIEKKPEPAPTQTAQSHSQPQVQQGAQASNLPHPHANVNNMSMPAHNIHFHQGMQNLQNPQLQANFYAQQAGHNMNFYNQGVVGQQGNKFSPQKDEDDFADFEEAKPTHAGAGNQPKQAEKPQNTKEDLLFGALENKVLKTLGYSHTEIPEGEGFGGFEEAKPHHAPEGDDFEEFEQATTGKPNPVNVPQNINNQQENMAPDKKLTIYDIDLSEFGITENAAQLQSASQGLGVPPPEEKPQQEKPQNVEIQDDFEDFVEIRDENENKEPEQVHVTHPPHPQGQGHFNQYGQGDSVTKPSEHPASSDWDFGDFGTQPAQTNMENKPQPTHDDDEFNDFEGPQAHPKEDVVHVQDEGDGFDDFHVVSSTHNAVEGLEVKKEPEEKNKQSGFEGFEFEKTAPPAAHGNDWYSDFMHPSKPQETKEAHANEQPIGKAHTDFNDMGFNFTSVTISAGDKKTTIINEEANKQEKDDEDFEDFEEYKNVEEDKKQHEKLESPSTKEQVKPISKEEEEDEDFGDFEGEAKTEKVKEKVHEDEHKQETHKEEDFSKKLTIYDIDLAEFGIQEGSQPGLPQMDLNFGKPSQVESDSHKPSHKEEKKPTGISDLYSLYENTSGTPISTPVTAEQPKAENLFGETLETQNIQETDQTGKHALSPQQGNDDFDDFEDFSAAPKQENQQAAVHKSPEKGDIFAEFHQGGSGNKRQEEHDFDFGNFESHSQPSKPGTHHEISHAKPEPKINESHEEDEHDDFDNFEEAGHAQEKPVKEEAHGKSVSDFGSLNDVGHHDGQHEHKKKHAGPRRSTELDRVISIEAPERMHGDHDDFGGFTNAEQNRKFYSSDHSPAKEKEKDGFTDDEHNDDFGDFVASKQDIKGKTQEVIVEEVEQYNLESVLAEYGIKEEEEPEEVDLTQYIEKRVEEINSEYQSKLFNTSYARTELSKGKFKLNRQIIEEIVKELSSIQKYREASNCEGQIKVLEELDELNDTKRQLIEDEKLEEAIQYRDLIKNKEKELITKEKLEEFVSHFNSDTSKSDYRVLLLEELKAAQVPINYINDFCLRFIGNLPKILKKTNIIQIHTTKPQEISPKPQEIQEPQNEKVQEDDSYHKIESQPVKEQEDHEDFGDFEGEGQTAPEEVQSEEKPVEKAEEEQQPEETEKKDVKDQEDEEDFGNFEGEGQTAPEEVQSEEKPVEKAEEEQPEEPEKKDDSHHKIESQPVKDQEDHEDFGDFEGEGQTAPEEVQSEEKPVEKAEEEQPEEPEKKIEGQGDEEDEGFGDFEKSPENKQEEQVKIEGEKEADETEEGFGDFEETNQPEIKDEKEEKEGPTENNDQGSSDFENVVQAEPSGEPVPKEEEQESPENKNKSEAEEEEGFGDFNNPEDEKKEDENGKEDNNEQEGETEVIDQNGAAHEEDKGDDFDDFKQVEEGENVPQEKNEDEGNEEGNESKDKEIKSPEEGKVKETEELQNEENEDFGDFENSKQVPAETPKEQEEHQEKQEVEEQEEDEGFGDFEGQEQKDQEKTEEVPEKEEEQNKVPSEKEEANEDFGEFEDFNQNQNQPETEPKEVANEENEQRADTENQVVEEKEANNDFGDFEDINQPQPAVVTEVQEKHVELYYINEEEIETLPEVPKSLLELQNLKEETTKWALLAKVIGSSGNKFDGHVKKLLNQIVFELHRFTKWSEKILNDTNKNSARMVITSSKYETYTKGIQIFISFYKELKTAYEFLNTRKQPTKLYQKPLEDLIAKVHNIISQIEQDFGTDFTYDVKNEGGQDLLLINQDLNAELLAHVCHLSLKIHVKKLTEYSGKHYFLPYLNFLLNIS